MFAGHAGRLQSEAPSSLRASYQHLLLMFPLYLFLHLVAFAVQNTDYFSIFINLSRGAKAKLLGAWDAESRFGMFSHAWETGERRVFAVLGILHRFRKGLYCNERIDLVDLWREKKKKLVARTPFCRAKTSLDMKKTSRSFCRNYKAA